MAGTNFEKLPKAKKSRKRESKAKEVNSQSCEASDYSTFLILLDVADSLKSDDHEDLLMALILSPSFLAEGTQRLHSEK